MTATGTSDKNSYLYLKAVEYEVDSYKVDNVSAREMGDENTSISRLKLENKSFIPDTIVGSFQKNYLTTVGLLNISDFKPSDPHTIFSYNSIDTPYQGWWWQPQTDVVDVIVKRSKINSSAYNQDISFNVFDDNIFIPGLHLPAGKDYGFLRFRKQGGIWEPDDDYQVNLSRNSNTFVYGDGQSINSQTFPQDAVLHIAENATVDITGSITLQQGTTVYLGPGATLKVTSGGTITADGTTFQQFESPTGTAGRWNTIKLLSGNNSFTGCTFKGAEKGLYVASSGNTLTASYFKDNEVGLWLNSGDATLKGTIVEQDPTQDGPYDGAVVRGTATLYTDSNTSMTNPTRFRYLDRGVDISDYGRMVAYHTAFQGNDYQVHLTGDGDLDNSGVNSGQGYSSYMRDPNTIYDIYNLSSNTASAQFNWWGSSTGPPANWRFYGNVDRQNPISCDPTSIGQHCSTIGSGDPCDPVIPCQEGSTNESAAPAPVMSSAGGNNGIALSTRPTKPAMVQKIKDVIQKLYQHIQNHPEDPKIYEYVEYVHDLLAVYDRDGSLRSWAGFDQRLEKWRNLYITGRKSVGSPALDSKSDAQGARSPLTDHPQVLARVGQTAMLIELNDLLHQKEYAEVLKRADNYQAYMDDAMNSISLISAKAVAWEQNGQFNKALAVYEQLEGRQQTAVAAISDTLEVAGYERLKAELADSMTARGQTAIYMIGSSEEDKNKGIGGTIPDEFGVQAPYPNPFSLSLVIPVDVPQSGKLTIIMYDMLGRKVAAVTDREYPAGRHEVPFNGTGLSSGVYMIHVQFEGQSMNRKVTLIK